MLSQILVFSARNGRWILAFSLIVGLVGGTLAALIEPYINWFIAALLLTAALRIGHRNAIGAFSQFPTVFGFTISLQLILPLTLAALAWIFNVRHELVLVIVLLSAASPLSGSPNLLSLMGYDGAPALRQLLLGTALLPLTIIPVLMVMPQAGDFTQVLTASLTLLAVIAAATALGFLLRWQYLNNPSSDDLQKIDGISTLLLAITVVGLMASIRTEFSIDWRNLLLTFVAANVVCFGYQIIAALFLKFSRLNKYAISIGVIAGTRNVALFLTAISPEIAGPLVLFVACYQIPMYLTPIIMAKFYQQFSVE